MFLATLLVTLCVLPHKTSSLNLKNQGLSSISEALIPKNVTELDLHHNRITCIVRSDFNNKFTELIILRLVGNTISHIDTGCFNGTLLREIYLGFNQLTKFPDLCLVKDTLRVVGLNGNPITSVSYEEVEYLEKLQKLTLSQTKLAHITDDLKRLNNLDLNKSSIPCCRNLVWVKDMGTKATTTDAVCSSETSLGERKWDLVTATDLQNESCPLSNVIAETSEFDTLIFG
jgi:Leucine-rich repeat (LRR) protein